MLGCNLRKPRSFPENECVISLDAINKPIKGGFQMKIACTINFVEIELGSWNFPAEQVEPRVKEGMIQKVKLDLTFLTKYIVDFPGH